jgi:hypothetical protein
VHEREHGRRAEAPVEADGEVDERDDRCEDEREDRAATQLGTDLGTHGLGAHHGELSRSVPGRERTLDLLGDALGTGLLFIDRGLILRAHGVVGGLAELRDLRACHTSRLDRGSQHGHIGRLLELELHERAARELDGVVRPAGHTERCQPDHQERDGDASGEAPEA